MLLILISWSILFLIFIGLGLLVRRFAHQRIRDAGSILEAFWIGWICTILFIQLWHCWFKVDVWALALTSVTGIAGLILNWQAIRDWVEGSPHFRPHCVRGFD